MMRKTPRRGEVLMMNQHWKIVFVDEGVIELENLETRDKYTLPLTHLYSLQAIITEVKRLYG
jgi:hypothetical protein